MDSKLKW